MTPSARRRYVTRLTREVEKLAARLERLTGEPLAMPPEAVLAELHDMAAALHRIREGFADAKGVHAAAAKDTLTHEQIGALLGVSKPYVQQMVYRGRKAAP